MKDIKIKTEIISISSRDEYLELDKFADKHWGETPNDGSQELNFFDTPKWAVIAKNTNDTDIIGELFIFPREVLFEGLKQKFIGVGGVVTHSDYRHIGVAKQILRDALIFAKANEFEYALLCADIQKLGKLYESVGFEKMTNNYIFTDKNGVEKNEAGGMIAPLSNHKKVITIQNSKNILNVGISNF